MLLRVLEGMEAVEAAVVRMVVVGRVEVGLVAEKVVGKASPAAALPEIW